MTSIKLSPKLLTTVSTVIIATKSSKFDGLALTPAELKYLAQKIKDDEKSIIINQLSRLVMVKVLDGKKTGYSLAEMLRVEGATFGSLLNKNKWL